MDVLLRDLESEHINVDYLLEKRLIGCYREARKRLVKSGGPDLSAEQYIKTRLVPREEARYARIQELMRDGQDWLRRRQRNPHLAIFAWYIPNSCLDPCWPLQLVLESLGSCLQFRCPELYPPRQEVRDDEGSDDKSSDADEEDEVVSAMRRVHRQHTPPRRPMAPLPGCLRFVLRGELRVMHNCLLVTVPSVGCVTSQAAS